MSIILSHSWRQEIPLSPIGLCSVLPYNLTVDFFLLYFRFLKMGEETERVCPIILPIR